MSNSPAADLACYIIASVTLLVGVGLGVMQLLDARKRSTDLHAWDTRFFKKQDFRRFIGSFLMVALAFGLVYGNTLPHKIENAANPLFVQVWFLVFLTLIGLLGLALWDWLANRVYSKRVYRNLERERNAMLRSETIQRSVEGVKRKSPYEQLMGDHPN